MFRSQTVRTAESKRRPGGRRLADSTARRAVARMPRPRGASASVASFPTCAARPAPRAPADTVPAKQGCTGAEQSSAVQARGSLQLPTYLQVGDGSSRFKFTKNISTL